MARYGFEQDKPERLAGIEATWDPGTRALLGSLGIGPGWRCLEAGAGGGSIAVWMADRVGPEGSVLAVDIDTTHVERLAGGVLEVRRHDLLRDDLPAGAFDLVHERSVLSWLGEGDALERLVASLAPGGWLLAEDLDWAISPSADGSPTVAKAYEAIISLLERVGYQRHYGRTLLRRLELAGLEETASEGRSYVLRGGSLGTAFDRYSLLAHRDALVATGALTESEFDETLRYLQDPGEHVLTPVLFAAWGRKPIAPFSGPVEDAADGTVRVAAGSDDHVEAARVRDDLLRPGRGERAPPVELLAAGCARGRCSERKDRELVVPGWRRRYDVDAGDVGRVDAAVGELPACLFGIERDRRRSVAGRGCMEVRAGQRRLEDDLRAGAGGRAVGRGRAGDGR
jgi:SAM-dependent methyltransferase